MSLTFGQVKTILSQYAGRGGKSPTSAEASLFTLQTLQYMLFSGAHGNLRKYTFHAPRGVFTAPYELETPLKVKIEGRVGDVWNKWFEFQSQNDLGGKGCYDASTALYEEPNRAYTIYDLPAGGARVAAMATVEEAECSTILIQGKDRTGREIFTTHNGERVSGEVLTLKKGHLNYSTVTFGEITGVVKPVTNGYVQLYWVAPTSNLRGFLADYSPVEERPDYRRFRLANCSYPTARVSVLGRIRLKPSYSDADLVPFDNLYSISVAGQGQNAEYNNDIQTSRSKDQFMQELITREGEYKKPSPGQAIECFAPISPGAIKNII